MIKLISSLFKNKKQQDVESLIPIVQAINSEHEKLLPLSDDELRALTPKFKTYVAQRVEQVGAEMANMQAQAEAASTAGDTERSEALFVEVDKLKKRRNEQYEAALNDILPQAFAVVKETCRRLAHNGKLVVAATDWDHQMADRCRAKAFRHVVLEGPDAVWMNQWDVTGTVLKWEMVHYDVQLIGGIVLHSGKISEMATGEGKTLVATLPAYLNALTGMGVHIVTVNDYLARRDMEWNAPIFQFHGISVDCIDTTEPNTEHRRAAYQVADITYGTNNEFGFDYLRDNMARTPAELVQREHHFAIVDEIDSVLIDEARTPLIISGPASGGDRHEFNVLKEPIERLVRRQKQIVQDSLSQAKTLIGKGETKEGGKHLFRAFRGLPQYGPLIKFLSEEGIRVALNKAEASYLADNQRLMPEVDEGLMFWVDERNRQVEMTDTGREHITPKEDPHYFILPDLNQELTAISRNANLGQQEKMQKQEELSRRFAEKSERLHSIQQMLKAYTLFENNRDYIIQEGKIMIVDENTGRVMPGRRWSDGLHQAIEAKENVKIEDITQTYATITLQNFFRMYHKLAGMTGTAETEASEFHQIYKLDVVVIPTNRSIVRKDQDDKVYRTKKEKFKAIVDEVTELSNAGRPVLVGTTSVETSEQLSRYLNLAKVRHNVLNAKHHAREAEIVAEAGQAPANANGKRIGNVTIATNMAGRGTDIKLGQGVREAGGLAIVGSERHDSRRIDLQLRGRAGRQGDPGSSQFYVALDDDLMRMFGAERIAKVMNFMKVPEGEVIQHKMITKSISNAQRKVEENNFGMRKRLLEFDDVMNKQREVVYTRRRNALFGDRLRVDLDKVFADTAYVIAEAHARSENAELLQFDMLRNFALDFRIAPNQLSEVNADNLSDQLYSTAIRHYFDKANALASRAFGQVTAMSDDARLKLGQQYEAGFLNRFLEVMMSDGTRHILFWVRLGEVLETQGQSVVREFEKMVTLGAIDDHWKEHLRAMDDLKQSVNMSFVEQKDPLLIYKQEAYNLFMDTMREINQDVVSLLCRADVVGRDQPTDNRQTPARRDSRVKATHADADAASRPAPERPTHAETEAGPERRLSRAERRMKERGEAKKKKKQNV